MRWLVAASLVIAGCASQNSSTNETATGTVVLSFAAERTATPFKAFDLRVVRSDGRFATAVPFIARGLASEKPDFASTEETGVIATLVLPAGEYEIKELAGYSGSVWWEHETIAAQQVPFRFTVQPGSEQYLGRFEAVAQHAGAPLSLVVADRASVDVAMAHAKYPRLGALSVAVSGSQQADSGPAAGALATP